MFRTSLCPLSGEQDRVLLHMVFCTGCAGCGCVELGRKLCALCAPQLTTQLHKTTANHSLHNQCRTPHAVGHGLILLMMDIMMPETCWDRSLIINIGLVASCWFISLHPDVSELAVLKSSDDCHLLAVLPQWSIYYNYFILTYVRQLERKIILPCINIYKI